MDIAQFNPAVDLERCDRLQPVGSIMLRVSETAMMLRVHGDRNTLLAHLMAQWAEQQLQITQRLRPHLLPPIRRPQPER
jgi:hypothetical protein